MRTACEWSVLRVTYPHYGLRGEQHVIETPSRQSFARRFAIIDPFQKPYLMGFVQILLDKSDPTPRVMKELKQAYADYH